MRHLGGGGPKASGTCDGGGGHRSRWKSGRSHRSVSGRRAQGGVHSMCASTRRWKSKEPSLRLRGPTCARRREACGCCQAHSNCGTNSTRLHTTPGRPRPTHPTPLRHGSILLLLPIPFFSLGGPWVDLGVPPGNCAMPGMECSFLHVGQALSPLLPLPSPHTCLTRRAATAEGKPCTMSTISLGRNKAIA